MRNEIICLLYRRARAHMCVCVWGVPDGAQHQMSRWRGAQAYVVAHLPSKSMQGPEHTGQERQHRRSVTRAYTVPGTLQRPSTVIPGNLPLTGTLPARLQAATARRSLTATDLLIEVAEELLAKDHMDLRSAVSDHSHAHLLDKSPQKRLSVFEEAEQRKRSMQFRERLRSVTLPIAERKAVW